ncbi:MAG: T9SS type A sorting domain-containing protein [Flavobacteriales bacterium]|nr:T9SS type A sorting domain-containing protein [Flavobacteriales bacterium]
MKIIFIISNLFVLNVFAQPGIIWQKTMGGNDYDWVRKCENYDADFFIGGTSYSSASGDKMELSRGESDLWLIKISEIGILEWQKTIGGSGRDALIQMTKDFDGGFLLGCTSSSNISGEKTENSRGLNDYWILKIDVFGSIVWQKTIGGNRLDGLSNIKRTDDNGLIIGGSSDSLISGEKTENPRGNFQNPDFWILKLNQDNEIEWQRTIGGDLTDRLFTIQITSDGGYILGGESNSNSSGEKNENSRGDFDYWIVKLNNIGEIEWQKTLGGSGLEVFGDLIISQDNGYIVGGYSTSPISGDKTLDNYGLFNFWVLKLNSEGEIIWQKVYGGFEGEVLNSIKQKSNGNILLAGSSSSNISGVKTENSRGSSDFWLLEVDENGEILGQKTIGGSEADSIQDLICLDDGRYFLAGNSRSGISGEKTETNRGETDYWVMLLEPNALSLDSTLFSEIKVFPNPTNKILDFRFPTPFTGKIVQTDSLGKVIQTLEIKNQVKFSTEVLGSDGIYFFTIENENGLSKTVKIVKQE